MPGCCSQMRLRVNPVQLDFARPKVMRCMRFRNSRMPYPQYRSIGFHRSLISNDGRGESADPGRIVNALSGDRLRMRSPGMNWTVLDRIGLLSRGRQEDVGGGGMGDLRSAVSAGSETRAEQLWGGLRRAVVGKAGGRGRRRNGRPSVGGFGGVGDPRRAVVGWLAPSSCGEGRRTWEAEERETFGRRFRRGRRPAPSSCGEAPAEQLWGGPR